MIFWVRRRYVVRFDLDVEHGFHESYEWGNVLYFHPTAIQVCPTRHVDDRQSTGRVYFAMSSRVVTIW